MKGVSSDVLESCRLVIPMSSKLGMIEWLDQTCPLKEVIERSYTSAEQAVLS